LFIAWTPVRKKYYPYLRRNFLQDGRVKSEAAYLGATLEEAEAALRKAKLPEEEKQRLIKELYRKQPKRPPAAQVEKKAARQLKRIAAWYPESEKVQQAVTAALAILEGGNDSG